MKLSINNLSKTYSNGIHALQDVNMEIGTGMFGLLGPNGAGKSTFMRIIATLQSADSGTVRFSNINVLTEKLAIKKVLGYLPQEFGFYAKDTAKQMLDHFALLKGFREKKERRIRVEQLLKKVNLWQDRNMKLGEFSGGMRQRFGIAQALLGEPQLIIVDEPTAGLDPAERNRFHNLLSEIGEDRIVLLSTHIVDDVSDLCQNMAIINQGRIIFKGNTEEAIASLQNKIWEKEIPKKDYSYYCQNYSILSERLFAGRTFIRIYSENGKHDGFGPADAALEDVYFYYLKTNSLSVHGN